MLIASDKVKQLLQDAYVGILTVSSSGATNATVAKWRTENQGLLGGLRDAIADLTEQDAQEVQDSAEEAALLYHHPELRHG